MEEGTRATRSGRSDRRGDSHETVTMSAHWLVEAPRFQAETPTVRRAQEPRVANQTGHGRHADTCQSLDAFSVQDLVLQRHQSAAKQVNIGAHT
jgi:hypothetical protein